MGKKLAIKGHSTRGKEVIELLKMMGGAPQASSGFRESCCYYISEYASTKYKYISWDYIGPEEIDKYEIFTLEEFLEEYPFKVGDFVRIPEYESEVRILKMKWCPVSEHIEYLVCPNDEDEWFTADELLEDNDNPLKDNDNPTNVEDTQSKRDIDKAEFMIKHMILPNKMDDKLEYEIIDGYEFDKVENNKIILKPIKPKYPTTYEECWKVRFEVDGETTLEEFHNVSGYYSGPLGALQKLLCCRDAYWKIAGEQMGLDNFWEPDWTSGKPFYCIFVNGNIIGKGKWYTDNKILAFPTEEMRDVFYKNFKNLIDSCKELL